MVVVGDAEERIQTLKTVVGHHEETMMSYSLLVKSLTPKGQADASRVGGERGTQKAPTGNW